MNEHLTPDQRRAELQRIVTTTPLGQIMPSTWYAGYMPDMPDLLVGRMPPALTAPTSPNKLNGTLRVVFVENDQDRREAAEHLARPLTIEPRSKMVDLRTSIDAINHRKSTRPAGDPCVWLYEAPGDGWPYVVVVAQGRNIRGDGFARDRYGWDAFASEAEALDHAAKLAKRLIKGGMEITITTPDKKGSN